MKYIRGYDGLRAYSVILVVLTHMGAWSFLPDTVFFRERFILLFTGVTGVQIFFALSGFLITRLLLIEKSGTGTIQLKNFYIRRFLRLLPPLILFYAVVGVLMQLRMIVTTKVGFIMALTYVYNFIPKKFYSGELGHMWSLAVEEQFYLLWPLVILMFRKQARLLGGIAIIVLLCFAAMYLLPEVPIVYNGEPAKLGEVFLVFRWFLPAVAPIMIGSGFAVAQHAGLTLPEKYRKWQPAAAFILYLSPLYVPYGMLQATYIIMPFGISTLLAWILHHQQSRFADVLEYKPISYVGKISYGIYVYQGFFLRTGPAEGLAVQQFPVNILLTIVVAVLSYELMEKRVLKLKNKFR